MVPSAGQRVCLRSMPPIPLRVVPSVGAQQVCSGVLANWYGIVLQLTKHLIGRITSGSTKRPCSLRSLKRASSFQGGMVGILFVCYKLIVLWSSVIYYFLAGPTRSFTASGK